MNRNLLYAGIALLVIGGGFFGFAQTHNPNLNFRHDYNLVAKNVTKQEHGLYVTGPIYANSTSLIEVNGKHVATSALIPSYDLSKVNSTDYTEYALNSTQPSSQQMNYNNVPVGKYVYVSNLSAPEFYSVFSVHSLHVYNLTQELAEIFLAPGAVLVVAAFVLGRNKKEKS